MTDLQRLARGAIVVGFDGHRLSSELAERLRENAFAGYILFARNVASFPQVRELTDALRALHDGPAPIVAIDQEGGRVARLREGAQTIPPMMALGATGDRELAHRVGESLAHDLRRAGCTVDYAPVLDLAADPMGGAIGTRAFAADPLEVAELGAAVASGLRAGGIVPTFKHFPGHGSTADDSHLTLPVIDMDERALRARDLLPFARVLPGAQAVMTAHIVVRALDPVHPATLSARILTGVLRDELGFTGVCFTDCMQMDAIARGIGTVEGVVAAIAAGADCALLSHDIDLAVEAGDALADAVREGRLDRARLEQACERVRTLREAQSAPLPLETPAPYPGIGREVAARAITAIRGVQTLDPSASVVVSFQTSTTEGVQGTFDEYPSLRAEAPALHEIVLSLQPSDVESARLADALTQTKRRPIVLARRARFYPEQIAAIRAVLEARPDAVLVALREPFDLTWFPQARHALAAYGDDDASIAALAGVLFGRREPLGALPAGIAVP